ncbi:MAG TPA: hypothetical protein VF875_03375 [Anaeromyxobacter sp.]
MHRESIYLCTYSAGAKRVIGRVRAWDEREAAQLFAVEMEGEHGARRVASGEVHATKTPPPGRLVRRHRVAVGSR